MYQRVENILKDASEILQEVDKKCNCKSYLLDEMKLRVEHKKPRIF